MGDRAEGPDSGGHQNGPRRIRPYRPAEECGNVRGTVGGGNGASRESRFHRTACVSALFTQSAVKPPVMGPNLSASASLRENVWFWFQNDSRRGAEAQRPEI